MNRSGYKIVSEGAHKVGLQDAKGREVLPCVYDKILDYDDDGYIRVLKGDVYGTIDLKGNWVIPHSAGITHLGVFHSGTARARIGDNWGLVDERDNEVTPFIYKSIEACHNHSYYATTLKGVYGTLTTDGHFTEIKNQKTTKGKTRHKPNSYEPKSIATKEYSCFDYQWFDSALSQWIGNGCSSSEIFFRDTDAPIDVDKAYKKGMVLRAGNMLQVTKKLKRPVHKLRFFIVSRRMYIKDADLNTDDLKKAFEELDYKEYFMHYNTCFVVVDVQKIKGKTQVVLKEIPDNVLALAEKYNINLGNIIAKVNSKCALCRDAKNNLEKNIDAMVHGNSLSDYWNEAMYRPVGYTKDLKKVNLAFQKNCEELSDEANKLFDSCHTLLSKNYNLPWKEKYFIHVQPNVIKVVVGDIAKLSVDAVVNAANTSLLGGTGVDGAIHKAAGEELLRACQLHRGCPTGHSKVTKGFRLPCQWIIHTVGPIWRGGSCHEDHLLAACYKSALRIATRKKLDSIAFPCISTGVYEFPKERAANIALRTILNCLKKNHYKGDVIICCYTEEDAKIYVDCLNKMDDYPKVTLN